MPELVRQVRESVRYESVERAAGVPAEIETEIRDEATGRRASVMLPLESEEASGWRWEGGFTFPVTVWGYDSGSFLLGGETVEVREDQPFAGYESALLELIGVDPEYYRIDSVEWSGPPENGENGQIRRQAAASGQKYVADIEAVYGGPAVIPAQPGTAYEAVYRRRMSETETEDPTEPETEAPKHETEASAASVPADPTQEEPEVLWWLRNLRYATTVIIGLGVLAGLPAVLMFFRRRKRRKENENRRKV